jgi:cytochrome c biogenesis protein CcmG, thiol:disulfide interchange protein DsbE
VKARIALRPGATRGQLRVLIVLLVVLLAALIAFIVVAVDKSGASKSSESGLGTVKVGAAAPSFAIPSLSGHGQVGSAGFGGTTTVLNFFASWCPPCRAETPLLARTAATHPQGVTFLGVDVADTAAAARHFLKTAGVTYSVGADPHNAITQRYGVYSLPESFLIGSNGRILRQHDGALTSKVLKSWIRAAPHA